MRALALVLLAAAVLAAGCAGTAPPDPLPTHQQMCESGRGGGVWMGSSGACFQGGG